MIDYYGSKVRVKFNKGCLKQSNNLTYDYGSRVNIYIVYELGASSSNDSDPTLKNCLFGAVTLTKNTDIENYGYSGFGIGFDGYVYDFSVDYDSIAVNDIRNIHKYLMKKNDNMNTSSIIKKMFLYMTVYQTKNY